MKQFTFGPSPQLLIGPQGLALGTGGGAVPGPYPPPSGFAWAYVTENGVTVTESGSPVVELVRVN